MTQPMVVHIKKNYFDARVDRQTKWGNPYTHLNKPTAAHFKVDSLQDALACFHNHLLDSPILKAMIGELTGQILGCWCAPLGGLEPGIDPTEVVCHGQILAYYANDMHPHIKVLQDGTLYIP